MRHGVRSDWASIPPSVRSDIDAVTGSAITHATNLPGGFSPGPAARCDLADGRRVFVKAAGIALNPQSPQIHRTEASVLAALPAGHPAPTLIGVVDDGDWVAVIIEWIDGRMPVAPLSTPDWRRMLTVAHRLAIEGDHVRPDGIGPVADRHPSMTGNWARLAADEDGTTDRLDVWSRSNLGRLADLDAQVPDAVAGDTLLQLDLRTDNVLFSPAGPDRDVVVDWPGAAFGAPWIDLATLLPALHLDGAPPPDGPFEQHPLGRRADPEAVTAFLAGLAGYFTRQALLAPPPGLPTVRPFQSAQGRITREWLARRLDGDRAS